MRVLIGMECSGEIRQAFQRVGWEAYSVDFKPAEDGETQFHIQGDVFDVLPHLRPDVAIFHPVCKWLSVSGMHWNYRGRNGLSPDECWEETRKAEELFMRCINADVPRICVENPVSIMSTRYRQPDQIIQPHYFGHDASKATCLWLKGLRLLIPTQFVSPRWVCQGCKRTEIESLRNLDDKNMCDFCGGRVLPRWANQTDSGQNRLGPSETRDADRARTYSGIAAAMATQWSR